jgi:type III secretion inner rod protein HrpB2
MNPNLASQFEYQIQRVTEIGHDPNAAPQELVDRFQTLLAQAEPGVHQTGNAQHGNNIVTKAIEEQADYYRQVPNDVMYMMHHMSALSMERLAAADMTIQLEIASLNADLQVKMATVQSSKDAVQTLMKNQ